MKKLFKNLSLIEFEFEVKELNFNRWYYDGEKRQGLVIFNTEDSK